MRIKLRHNKDVVCPYLEGKKCYHPRCYRMRRQECKFYHNAEELLRAQMTVKVTPTVKNKQKYLRRVNYGKNKVR